MPNNNIYAARARLARALANPDRLRIIDALASKPELCVCELVELLQMNQTTVSKHLAVLRTIGVVQSRKQGLQVYCRLKTPCVTAFFACADRVLACSPNCGPTSGPACDSACCPTDHQDNKPLG